MKRSSSWLKRSALLALFSLFMTSFAPFAVAADKVLFYHSDPLGTPMAITDSTQTVVWQADYKPFGEEKSAGDNKLNDKTFIGKEKDDESGLHYFGARYHASEIGRFISPDPVGAVDPFSSTTNTALLTNPQRLNYYAYSLNNPYRYVDPDGNIPLDTVWDIGMLAYDLVNGNWGDAAADVAAIFVPYVPAGITKLKYADEVVDAVRSTEKKTDFIVSPNGTAMPTNKDFNLVDSNVSTNKGGDWFQIHNNHTDAKVDGLPHTHFPVRHNKSTTREIKRTNGQDLDRADNLLRNGQMRERLRRNDKGGPL